MSPKKRTTRASPATTTTTTTPVTNAQLKALIDQGVADALAARDADRSWSGNDSYNSGTVSRRTKQTARECTYTDFLKCQPINFKVENQVKFATCTLHGVSLTWWKSHVKTAGHDVVYGVPWSTLMKMMIAKYCPRNKIKKLEIEIWELKVKVEFATELMDKKICTFAERQTENKRKQDDNQHQQNKRHITSRAYTVGPGEKKPYGGSKPLCSKCNYHHDGPCAPKCHKCNRVGYLARDCRSPTATNNQRNLTFYECRNQRHYKSDCPELKNQNYGNQTRGTRARGMVHALWGGEPNQDLNNIEDDINS
uniref:CCHC-type domain-containing protein n=1 Tax=Tanacetum cinerariifolium TaxID=118510 RepID=A0A6L2JHK3_TANCI|nr:hypothetical protein [Tanacetum cinerariifolium]